MNTVATYLKDIETAIRAGNATEHTHRPALKALVEAMRSGIVATNDPKRIDCGAPDLIVTKGQTPLGHIETKDVGNDLSKTERSEQLARYRAGLSNLLLTDYLEFRWYRSGDLVQTLRIADVLANGRLRPEQNASERLEVLLSAFLDSTVPSVRSPRELAERMARLGRLLHDLICASFKHEGPGGDLHGQYQAFRKVLLSDLSVEQFADMYAQTIAYGLFAARCNHSGPGFTREHAGSELPKTNPFLRKLFNTIAGPDLDDRISWAVDDLAELLAKADMAVILEDFGRATRQEDPVVHFYETFLAAYDPKLREMRGVYYTPGPIVGYIVRSIDAILKSDFKLRDGLADKSKVKLSVPIRHGKVKAKTVETHRVQILDPALGTGTFLHSVIGQIFSRFTAAEGMWPSYVADHLLPRIYGFEILMAPYAMAHMKLGLLLKDTGYDFAAEQRLGVFLTNSLEEAHETAGLPLFAQWLADEAAAASVIKRESPIMIVLGNPPYSGHSANKGAWIEDLMEPYKKSPELKKPAQAKWLSDDYVKFIRFAQWRIEQTGYGILGFITNHSWLDNPTFMDMRASLMSSFDQLHVLDLHGNSKKTEAAPDGSKDENVFDIQQGVSICLLVRRGTVASPATQIRHADLWGSRESKYAWLSDHDVTNTPWTTLTPSAPRRLFVPRDEALLAEYGRGISIVDAMNKNGAPAPGFATQHDDFAISYSEIEAIEKVSRLLASASEAEAREQFTLCAQAQWRYSRAKAELTADGARQRIIAVKYRPFDDRVTIYDRNVLTHRRERISAHLLRPNLALVIPKNAEALGDESSQLFFCVDKPTDLNFFRRGGAYLVPLYLYDTDNSQESLFHGPSGARTANFSADFLEEIDRKLRGNVPSPETMFAYIYGVLFSMGYRTRYGEFLKRDFPRVQLTSDPQLFERLASLGQELIDLHLMRSIGSTEPGYPVAGDNRVEKVEYRNSRVYINSEQYFDQVSTSVWTYSVGGYPVALKWLKDRRDRRLSFDELQHYRRVIAALSDTIKLQDAIDATVPAWPLP